jgi:DNA polymerase-4
MCALLHFDADAFFASVEQAADRHLRGKPVAVGGLHRGIIASASYEARRLGIYTPMPTSRARKLCPQLVILPVRFELYEQFSANIFGLAEELTPAVEKQSVDEGYLDLTGTQSCLKRDPCEVAEKFRRDVKDWLKITISQGVARTKLLSQIASKLRKPDNLITVPFSTAEEIAFLHPLPVKWLPGVGPSAAELFHSAGVTHIGQVARMPVNWLSEIVGTTAPQVHAFANNIDHRPVVTSGREAASYGHQETFDEDTADYSFILGTLYQLADKAFVRLRAGGHQARTITVKLRYCDADEHQRQLSLAEPTDVETRSYPLIKQLLNRLWDRRVRLRMVQVKLSNIYSGFRQLDLFGQQQKHRDLAITCEHIREKFGPQGVMRLHDWQWTRKSTGATAPSAYG